MKILTTLDQDEPRQPWLTGSEHYLVEVECVLSGRAAVHNAVLRNGEGYMRQVRELPPVVAIPDSAPAHIVETIPTHQRVRDGAIVVGLMAASVVTTAVLLYVALRVIGAAIERAV